MVLNQLEELASKSFDELGKVTNLEELEAWRIRYLGKKSDLIQTLRSLATLSLKERQVVGARANEVKKAFETGLAEKKKGLEQVLTLSWQRESLDVTLPGESILLGRLHPTTQTLDEICSIFGGMVIAT